MLAPLALCVAASGAMVAPPQDHQAFSRLMRDAAGSNETLLQYALPRTAANDVQRNWVVQTAACEVATDCYCYHVQGDMSRMHNPDGWQRCAPKFVTMNCSDEALQAARLQRFGGSRNCCCLRGPLCMFTDMRPGKILAAIAAARAAGVTRIVEEGRFGALSTFMYALHGFEVVSIEFLPLTGPTDGLERLAPQVKRLTGDGRVLLPEVLDKADAHRTMVIFDGEKREYAWKTFDKLRGLMAAAIFDDSNSAFNKWLTKKGEIWWWTRDTSFVNLVNKREASPLQLAKPLREKQCQWHGGVDQLDKFDFTIVRAGAWTNTSVHYSGRHV